MPFDESEPQKSGLERVDGTRSQLFYERYGILENPFGVTPNPRYLYQSRTHAKARSSLMVGIQSGVGFQALIAPPGMGKTTILFNLLQQLNDLRAACFFQFQGNSRDFLRHLIVELGGEDPDSDQVSLQETINQMLHRENRAGRPTVVIVDEAQNLDNSVLETVRLLSNFETATQKLLHIIFAGQPQMALRLASPELAQLCQRIPVRTKLVPFDLQDTRNYIEHRLRVAGYQGPPLFTPAAIGLISELSHGVPREINTLCFNALLLATAAGQKHVDSEILNEVLADLEFNTIQFTETYTGDTGVQTSEVPGLGDTPADLPEAATDKIGKAGLPRSGADAGDDVACAGLPELPGFIDPAFCFVGWEGSRKGVGDHDEIELKDHKTVDLALPANEVTGAAGGETEATRKATELPLLNPSSVDPQDAHDVIPRLPEQRPLLTDSRWITAIADPVIVSALIMLAFSILSVMHSGLRAGQHSPAQSPGRQGSRSTHDGRGSLADVDLATATGIDKSPAHPNIDVTLPAEDQPSSLSGPSIVPGPDLNRQAPLAGNIVPARLIRMVKPVYPATALKTQSQGDVVLQVMVDQNGVVQKVRFVSGPAILALAAFDAVELWRYRPAQVNGQTITWETSVTIKFSLR
jgi:general secretion pathway protein A